VKRTAVCLGVLVCLAAGGARAAGDPARGEKLHRVCLQCHGTELYVPPRAKVKTYKALVKEIERWGDSYNPGLSKQDVEDLAAWLNRDFYKLPK
jgi:mono/diheme cytochrome c family protein